MKIFIKILIGIIILIVIVSLYYFFKNKDKFIRSKEGFSGKAIGIVPGGKSSTSIWPKKDFKCGDEELFFENQGDIYYGKGERIYLNIYTDLNVLNHHL